MILEPRPLSRSVRSFKASVPKNTAPFLTRLLFPQPVKEFFESFWGQRVFFRPAQKASPFHGVFSSAGFEHILGTDRFNHSDLYIITADQGYVPLFGGLKEDGRADLNKLFGLYSKGATLVLNHLRHRWFDISRFCADLEEGCGHPVNSNCYLTPPRAQGFPIHADPHDVFVLQLEGKKYWKVFSRGASYVLDRRGGRAPSPGDCQEEYTMAPGDLLYIPSGYPHCALTNKESHSLHLSFGVHRIRWADLVSRALLDLAESDEMFRRALPAGVLTDKEISSEVGDRFVELVSRFGQKADLKLALAKLRIGFGESIRRNRGLRGGAVSQFSEISQMTKIGYETTLKNLFPGCFSIENIDQKTVISYPGGRCDLEERLLDSTRFILSTAKFTVRDIPGVASLVEKRALAQRFIVEGVIQRT